MKTGTWVIYNMLSTVERKAPPISQIKLTVGPHEEILGKSLQWWEFEATKESGDKFEFRMLSESVPMLEVDAPGTVARYIVREGLSEPIEYVDAQTGTALLPKFDFPEGLLPQPIAQTQFENGFATTGTCLGHVVSMTKAGNNCEWQDWPEPNVLTLNLNEQHYMYGLGRDTEDRYIYEGDYNYTQLTREELDELIDLGMNSFSVDDQYEEWVYRKPVLYYKQFSPQSKLNYPEILYRSNFRGGVAFIDEPEIHLLGDKADLERIIRPEDGAALLTQRLRQIWDYPAPGEWRRTLLREQLLARGANIGTLSLDDNDHPIWVTMLETSFYQLQGGAAGVVHEGRYQLAAFAEQLKRLIGYKIDINAKEMLLLNFAWLRGAARAFDKDWGIAIYGQCDPQIAPDAISLAWDMGARYIWFWTYDHQHHLPHFMKIRLLKHLKAHKSAHPRRFMDKLLQSATTAIVLPYGYGWDISFEKMWESPHLHIDSINTASAPHKAVIGAALRTGIECIRAGEQIDFVIDAGQSFDGYTRIIKIERNGDISKR